MSKLRVAVIFGGRSGEHEVSMVSARAVIKNLDRSKYRVILVKISKAGAWSRDLKKSEVDVAFPLVHGTFGEDGCLQGHLEILDVPYVGCGVLASALGMDKIIQKQLFAQAGLPIVRYESFTAKEWKLGAVKIVRRIENSLGYKVFIKPANMGSSVGVSKAGDRQTLKDGVNLALKFDDKVLVEHAVPQAREIEVAVLGNETPQASVPGEIILSNLSDGHAPPKARLRYSGAGGRQVNFYDYDAKYVDDASESVIPAKLTVRQSQTIRKMAVRSFQAIDGRGMARVDFLISGRGRIMVNEINTIPGFTEISMFPKLWAERGLSFRRLLDRLITLAIQRHKHSERLNRSYLPKKDWWI